MSDSVRAHGRYDVVCYLHQRKQWQDHIDNLWTVEGKNRCLDEFLSGVNYTAFIYLGLISSVGYSVIADTDTASQINGGNRWKEASDNTNLPTYQEGARPLLTFAAASGSTKQTASGAVFTLTANGTVKGSFAVTSPNKAGTGGTLISLGLFSGGDKIVTTGQILTVTWTPGL